jgi:NhaA family Na+:H+ antiporter
MATDIAFALAVVKSVGKRAPLPMVVFLTAFAIIDDIGAVLVIALFYSEEIKVGLLLLSIIPMVVLTVLGYLKFYSRFIWFVLGATVWLLFLKAGIHPTIAGVLLAFTVPLKRRLGIKNYIDRLSGLVQKIKNTGDDDNTILTDEQLHYVNDLEKRTEKVQSPLQQLEHRLHYWVAILILPIFALANAGVVFNMDVNIDWRLAMVISVSLFVGKFIGVPLFTYIGLRLKLTELPRGMNLHNVIGSGLIAGVGFTMSIFISNLAFADPILTNSAKIGILIGSFVAGVSGYLFMRYTGKSPKSGPVS